MTLAKRLTQEFVWEMGRTRRILELVPEDRTGWRPHHGWMTLGALAAHLAMIPRTAVAALSCDESEARRVSRNDETIFHWTCRVTMLAGFDEAVGWVRNHLYTASDEDLTAPWTLKLDGVPHAKMRRSAALRVLVLNHAIHHRGQLTVYLRLNHVSVDGEYAPDRAWLE